MATSLEKIDELREHYEGAPSADADPLELSIRTMLQMGLGSAIMARLPDEPEMLDELLVHFAGQLLDMRSDGAGPVDFPAVAIVGTVDELPAAEHPDAGQDG